MTSTLAAVCLTEVINPGIKWCQGLPGWKIPFDNKARVPLLAIAGQEGGYVHRVQTGNGLAHGLWQFERGGGVTGVLTHPASKDWAIAVCKTLDVVPNPPNAWGFMATAKGDSMALAFARLLLWTDPHPLPAIGDVEGTWQYYLRNWRPGKPRRDDWTTNYTLATDAIENEET